MKQPVERRLAAILAADVAGYSRLMGVDEEGTHERLRTLIREVVEPKTKEHRGRIVKNTGDGMLVEFPSVVDAVRCAVAIQNQVAEHSVEVEPDKRIEFRIGINLGDVIVEDGDIFGDGVNVAARLEALAEPGGICVSRVVRDQVRDKLDLAFEDMGQQQVKNIARPVRVYRVREATGKSLIVAAQAALPLPDKPSLAVLPFQNMTGDAEQDYFVDGIVEEITTAISRLPWLFVIARNSSFTYKGRAVDVKQVAEELGVRYVLEGSVRKSQNRVRITGQLIDTATGAHLWADRFDGALDDIFELQDQVASSVVGAIEPKLRQSETERALRKPTDNLSAYDLYLRALAEFQKFTQSGRDAAVVLLTRALTIDPDYAPAAALIGWCRLLQTAVGSSVSADEIAESVRLATQVNETGKDQPDALCLAAYTLAFFTGAHATAAGMIDHALTLNPNSALAWACRGWVAAMQDQVDPAIESLQRAMRLSPLDPLRWVLFGGMCFANSAARHFEEAIDWADRSIREQPRYASAYRMKAIACVHLGRAEEARECARHVLELQPAFTISGWVRTYAASLCTPKSLAMYVDGLRKAGLPEE
jgi:adenylate cyclase